MRIFRLAPSVEVETTDTQEILGLKALLDSGTSGLFLHIRFVREHGLTIRTLSQPISINNVDGTANAAGAITEVVDLVLRYNGHSEHVVFVVTDLGEQDMILGYTWLKEHNPEIDWAAGTVERKARAKTRAAMRACRSSGIPTPEPELDNIPELYPDLDCEDDSDSDRKTTSQRLAEAFAHNSTPKSFRDAIPDHLHDFEDIFSKAAFNELLERKQWDHAIELEPSSTPSSCKVYLLAPNEQAELNTVAVLAEPAKRSSNQLRLQSAGEPSGLHLGDRERDSQLLVFPHIFGTQRNTGQPPQTFHGTGASCLAADYTVPDHTPDADYPYTYPNLSPTISSASSLDPSYPPSPDKTLRSPFRTPDPPAPSEAPRPTPQQPPAYDDAMAKDETSLFRGDHTSTTELPHTWFRRLEGRFDENTPLSTQLYRFEKSLEPGRRPLYTAFTVKWPLPTIVEPTRDEFLKHLHDTKLKEDMVGQLVEETDKVYSHVKWAEDIRALTDVLEHDSGHLIPEVRRGLPLVVHRLLPASGQSTWAAFLSAVTDLSPVHIDDELEHMAWYGPAAQVQAQAQPGDWQKDMNALTAQFSNAAVIRSPARAPPPSYHYRPAFAAYQPQPQQQQIAPNTPQTNSRQASPHMTPGNDATPHVRNANAAQPFATPTCNDGNPFMTNTSAPAGSLFNPRTPGNNTTPETPSRMPSTELARRAVELSMVYPATPEGIAMYTEALQRWEAMHTPSREVDFQTPPYPLTPGTKNIGSPGESTGAALARPNCPLAVHARRAPEQSFGVSQINATEETAPYEPRIYNAAALNFEDDCEDQGNGQEARA
ncbi:hypothetical protein LshimejAT787_0706110 [Lyophyllum shimeji]|uniref:Uncharacterized protein n=1 Tax=Lyophyllum shimeji TaxID=47721 RepID=A0A9P3PQW1_LYOSH|nr:hypothetical protein LshimejAT787_0706110 [Lyophyllum shimeji]